MNRPHRLAAICAATAVLGMSYAFTKGADPAPLTVHEWGTFTSVANADGTAATWQTLSNASDLPCFVERIKPGVKGEVPGTVRMETPVLYFYTSQDTTVNVSVRFLGGLVTEWFPRAAVTPDVLHAGALASPDVESRITWTNVRVRPGASPAFPAGTDRSHYYAARETDAAPLESGADQEKFLFYRGIGRFPPPLTATIRPDGSVDVRSVSSEPVGTIVLFENRRGTIGYRIARSASHQLTIEQPSGSGGDRAGLQRELERVLVAQGLYEKEAAAMVATWRDSWFEEGARLFYLAPKSLVDAVLPLQVKPNPTEVARVFVGRVELVTPRTMQDVKDAVVANDFNGFASYQRFMGPITVRIRAEASPTERPAWDRRVREAYASYYQRRTPPAYCK
jgi:hypothetical protein